MCVWASVGSAEILARMFVCPNFSIRMTVLASVYASVFGGGRERDRKATEVMLCEETGGCRQIVSFLQYHH